MLVGQILFSPLYYVKTVVWMEVTDIRNWNIKE